MLKSEGYKMFRGTATIVPINLKFKPFSEYGDWLYKPEYDCWYVNGKSYPAEIVKDVFEEQDAVLEALEVRVNALNRIVVTEENIEEVAVMCKEMKLWLERIKK